MAELITNVVNFVSSIIGDLGPFFGFFIIFLESIIPILPLSVFIALNVVTFGSVVALIISWIGTIFGCICAFYLSRYFSHFINKKIKHNKTYKKYNNKIKEFRKFVDKISFSNLVLFFAIPFAPAFPVNIAAGISNMSEKKFIAALIIGKLPMVYFWVFIGKNIQDCLTDITVLAKIVFMLVMAYLVSKITKNFIKE